MRTLTLNERLFVNGGNCYFEKWNAWTNYYVGMYVAGMTTGHILGTLGGYTLASNLIGNTLVACVAGGVGGVLLGSALSYGAAYVVNYQGFATGYLLYPF